MKFAVNSLVLQRSLSKLGGVIQPKSTMPILEHLLFDVVNNTLTATATDLGIWMTVKLEVQGQADGKITVPAKRFTDTLRSLPDTDVDFAADTTTNRITVKTSTGEFNLTGDHHSAFPATPETEGTEQIDFEGPMLRKIIQKTSFAVSQDELRPAMNGVLVVARKKSLTAVATDGHRLVRYGITLQKPIGFERDVIIPVKTFNIVGRSLEDESATMILSKSHIRLKFPSWEVVSRLIDETYPRYESVIPPMAEDDKILKADRETLIQSIRRVSLYANASTHQVRFDIAKDELRVAAQDVDFGWDAKEKVACTFSDTVFMIGFNATYLVDLLSHLDGEVVQFHFSTPTKAGIILPEQAAEGEDLLMLVMPVRLNT